MIADSLRHHAFYRNLHPALPAAFDYLRHFDPATPDGRVDLDGDRVFALIQSYETVAAEQKRYEAHRVYMDLQYLVEGVERVYHLPLDRLTEEAAYDADKDVAKYAGEDAQALVLRAGDFAIFYPHDGHKPSCADGPPGRVKKVVFKIAVR